MSSPAASPPAPDRWALLADLLDPEAVDVFGALNFEPNPGRQTEFLEAEEFDVLYGGAAGGGKTKALLVLGLRTCVDYPGIQVWCFRRSYPELRDSLIRELAQTGYAKALGATWRESTKDLVFPNGSVMRFRYCESMADATRYQGAEMQLLLVDERTLLLPDVVEFLASRLRSSDPAVPVLGIRSGTNPGGAGHGAVKDRYITATNYGADVITDERGRTVRFIPARITDNPKLNPEYERDLEALPEALRSALRDGSWDTFAGQVFTQWRHDRHVVRPFAIPEPWGRAAAVDYGHAAPWCVLWGALDSDRRLWLYREMYDTGVGEREQARRILRAEGALVTDGVLSREPTERVGVRLADPSMWAKTGDANPIAHTYVAEGCLVLPATNDRLGGLQRVHSYLDEAPACPIHRELGWETCPRLHVFETCSNLIRTLPTLPYDTKKVEDVDTDAEDHAYDALRYLVMQMPLPTVGLEIRREPESYDERFAQHLAARRKPKRTHPTLGRI